MLKSFFITIIFMLSFSSIRLYSQALPPEDVQISLAMVVEYDIPNEVLDTLTNPFYLLQQETDLKIALNMLLPDTGQVSKINVKLGTMPGASDLLNHSFVYDGNPGGTYSYLRNGNFLVLGLGNYSNSNNALYYSEVEIEDAAGNKSSVISTDTSQ